MHSFSIKCILIFGFVHMPLVFFLNFVFTKNEKIYVVLFVTFDIHQRTRNVFYFHCTGN